MRSLPVKVKFLSPHAHVAACAGSRKVSVSLELVVAVGFAASNGEARRLVEGGGVRLNNRIVDDPRRRIGTGDLQAR